MGHAQLSLGRGRSAGARLRATHRGGRAADANRGDSAGEPSCRSKVGKTHIGSARGRWGLC